MSAHRPSVTGSAGQVRKQSSAAPPVQDKVRVAVLPPRLPADMAPPTGLGPADAMAWDEKINWRHNEAIGNAVPEESGKGRKWLRKSGMTTQRTARNEDMPPFTFREVDYDTWRKHYAKDAHGRYHGTHAPAEDCLLLPEDVEKWRLGEAKTKADLWTRGTEALPVYEQVKAGEGLAPSYTENDDTTRVDSVSSSDTGVRTNSMFTADGKSSEQIIAEAKIKAEEKKAQSRRLSWKERVKKGAEYAMMGAGSH